MFSRFHALQNSSRAQDLDRRSQTTRQTRDRGQQIEATGNHQQAVSDTLGGATLITAVPVVVAAPIALVPYAFVMTAASHLEEGAERNIKRGKALAQHANYKIDLVALNALGFKSTDLQPLVDAKVVVRIDDGSYVGFWAVVPNTNISAAVRHERFAAFSDEQRTGLIGFLQRIVEMAPIVEAMRESEDAFKKCMDKKDSEGAKIHMEQLAKLRILWASDGTAQVQHDQAFDVATEDRTTAFLRNKLGTELSKPRDQQDPFAIRELRRDIATFENLVKEKKELEEAGKDLIQFD